MCRKSIFLKSKPILQRVFCLMLCATLMFLTACRYYGSNNGGSLTVPEQTKEAILPEETSAEVTDTKGLKPSPEVHRGYPAPREECYVMAYTGNVSLNLNPFAEGGGHFFLSIQRVFISPCMKRSFVLTQRRQTTEVFWPRIISQKRGVSRSY